MTLHHSSYSGTRIMYNNNVRDSDLKRMYFYIEYLKEVIILRFFLFVCLLFCMLYIITRLQDTKKK